MAVATIAAPLAKNESPIPGYEVIDMQWKIQAFPGGNYTHTTGTIQQVVAQLNKINPEFEQNVLAAVANWTRDSESAHKVVNEKNWEYESHYCFGPFPPAFSRRVYEGIAYLESVKGQPVIGPGPGQCSRVSCGYHAAIWWCNDNEVELRLDEFNDIARGAYGLYRHCRDDTDRCSGQLFFQEKWNVIVRENDC
ncbi:hypothetical protein B0T16DRAFT_454937 [Cercophora newfieldiana]|uniref:Uncharacterized protein n=1 Tax=Cercophora newfieldiana TaxID=92897 RepID=A0AA40CVW4_9PEZI|nr:hypothetical protein B0T16DRAFT_454937 [Cercophora newfieldiana]